MDMAGDSRGRLMRGWFFIPFFAAGFRAHAARPKVVAHMMPDLPNMGLERDIEGFTVRYRRHCGNHPSLLVVTFSPSVGPPVAGVF